MIKTLHSAWVDIYGAIKQKRVWLALASENISDQHRRTTLGPLWLLLNYLAFAGTFIVIFKRGEGVPNYAAYVGIGLFVWLYISEVITQSITLFVQEESFLKGTKLPITIYVMRLTTQTIIRTVYTLVGCVIILVATSSHIENQWPYAFLSMAYIISITPAAITIFAFLGAYFPDSQFILGNIIRIGMFLTPIFWLPHPGESGLRNIFYTWNPFTYFLDIVRSPVISGGFPTESFIICLIIGSITWSIALLLLGHLRKRIVFVL